VDAPSRTGAHRRSVVILNSFISKSQPVLPVTYIDKAHITVFHGDASPDNRSVLVLMYIGFAKCKVVYCIGLQIKSSFVTSPVLVDCTPHALEKFSCSGRLYYLKSSVRSLPTDECTSHGTIQHISHVVTSHQIAMNSGSCLLQNEQALSSSASPSEVDSYAKLLLLGTPFIFRASFAFFPPVPIADLLSACNGSQHCSSMSASVSWLNSFVAVGSRLRKDSFNWDELC
jgi:hypothetical protein